MAVSVKYFFYLLKMENSHKFWTDGFILLEDYLTSEEGDKIVNWADQLEEYPEEAGKWMIYFESENKKSRIENILDYHQGLKNFVHDKITPLLESIYMNKMTLFKDKMNWKRGYSKGFKAHQDQPAWSDFPPQIFITVALFANDTTIENGCLEFVSKRHQEGIFNHNISGKGELDAYIEEKMDWKNIPTTTRDILIFDSYAPHRSGENNTDGNRRIFYFTYNLENDGNFYYDYIRKKRQEFPPNIERKEGVIYNGNRYNLANPMV